MDLKRLTLKYGQDLNTETLFKDETLFHVANGFIGKKAYFIEGYGFDTKRTIVMNGFYNRYPYHYEENAKEFPQFGQTIMPLPEAFFIELIASGIPINISQMTHIHTVRHLYMDSGYYERITRYQNSLGQRFDVTELALTSLKNLNQVLIKVSITALDEDCTLECIHHIGMPKIQTSKERDPRVAYEKKHLNFLEAHVQEQSVNYHYETISKQFNGRLTTHISEPFQYKIYGEEVIGHLEMSLKKGIPLSFTCEAMYETNHIKLLTQSKPLLSFEDALMKQKEAVNRIWNHLKLDVQDESINTALNYHMYQLYVSGAVSDELSIAAKGLSGEGYEGHYFWDTEMYMLPYFVMHHPDKARHILKHRMMHLEKARFEARQLGILEGAKIPWRSIDGHELSPYFPAGSAQLHINSDIAYGFILYTETTGDMTLLQEGGFEFLIELALYILNYGEMRADGFHIPLVTGPDEYTPLVHDNYYTNQMAKMHFSYVYTHYQTYKTYVSNPLKENTLEAIKQAVERMYFTYDDTLHIHLQDQEHLLRKPLPVGILPNEGLPLMLKKHPHFIYRHQVLKQADSIAADVVLNHFDEYFESSFHHYLKMTSHDSSLSKCMYGIGAYHLNIENLGDSFFHDVLYLDIHDHKKHTKNGLHLANTGGAFLMVLRGLLGIYTMNGLSIYPTKLTRYQHITYAFLYHNQRIEVILDENTMTVKVEKAIRITLYQKVYDVHTSITLERL